MTLGHLEKMDGENDWSFESSEISTTRRSKQTSNAISHISETFGGMNNSSIFDLENANFSIVFKLEFVGNSTFFRLEQLKNASSHIFETFDGIKIFSIFELKNALFSIICKLEFVGNSTFFRLEQL